RVAPWTGTFQVREYAMLLISVGALLWLLPIGYFVVFMMTALAVYSISEAPYTRNQKLVLVLSVLALFVIFKYRFPMPALPNVVFIHQGIEAFFLLRCIDFALIKSHTIPSPYRWHRVVQYLLYISFLPTLFAGPILSFYEFYKGYQADRANWFGMLPRNLS